jgi:broad specificity phosphatase PhoE
MVSSGGTAHETIHRESYMVTTFYLIRHGETDWNVERRWQGHADATLNDRGRRQAQLVAARMQAEAVAFDAIYSSDLDRAFKTAWAIAATTGVPVQLLPPLREMDVGNWSGFTFAEIQQRYPVETRLLVEGQDLPRGGGETFAALQRRVVRSVTDIATHRPGETILLVTHGGCIRALLAHAARFDGHTAFQPDHIGNTSISIIRCDSERWHIDRINDISHLEAEHDPNLISAPADDAEPPV